MTFLPKTQAFSAEINTVTIGTGACAVTFGGGSALPFYTFDAPTVHAPKIGAEVSDLGLSAYPQKGLREFYAGCESVADMAKRAQTMPGVSFLCLCFESADPNGLNRPVADCVALAKQVHEVTDLPLVLSGCKHIEKDAALFAAICAALPGEPFLLLSAREENYREIAASAQTSGGQTVGAESSVDISLAKQLNVLLTQAGVAPEHIVMNAGAAAAGYGFEYVISTMERIRTAALAQDDELLQMPMLVPVSAEAWSVKEAVMPEAELPAWGECEQRGIEMEITTAAACLASGADAVILRHPSAAAAISALIDALA